MSYNRFVWGILLTTVLLIGGFSTATAAGNLGVYGIYMVPRGVDAEDYSRPSFGLGIQFVAPLIKSHGFLYGVAGLEVINFLSENQID